MKKMYFLLIYTLFCFTSFSQNTKDSSDGRFHDDLLDHLVGNWNVSSVAHGSSFTGDLDARWVLNHQYLLIHLKSHQVIPWWHVQMEFYQYVGYNHHQNRYTIHGMSIEGDEDLSEGFCYGYRAGNEFKTVAKFGGDTMIVQRFNWQPHTKSWIVQSRTEIGGKESEVFLELKFVAAKKPKK